MATLSYSHPVGLVYTFDFILKKDVVNMYPLWEYMPVALYGQNEHDVKPVARLAASHCSGYDVLRSNLSSARQRYKYAITHQQWNLSG